MDIKSKNISYSNSIKTLVFILTLIASLCAVSAIVYTAYNQEYILSESFEKTYAFKKNYEQSVSDLLNFELDLINKDYINETYTEKQLRISKLREYKIAKEKIDNNVNFLYYLKNLDDNSISTNVSKSFAYLDDQLSSIYYLNSELNSLNNRYNSNLHRSLERLDEHAYEFRAAVKKDLVPGDIFYDEYIKYSDAKKYSQYVIVIGVISSIISFFGFIYLITTTGRIYKDSELKLSAIDIVPYEIQFFFFSTVLALVSLYLSNVLFTVDIYSQLILIISTIVLANVFAMILLLSIARRIKDRSFFKNFLVYKLSSKCFRFVYRLCKNCLSFFINKIKSMFDFIFEFRNKGIFKSWILAALIIYLIINAILVLIISNSWDFIFVLSIFVFIILNAKVVHEIYKFLDSLQKLIHASDSVSYASDVKTIELNDISPSLHELASNIINIQIGIKKAVDKALKGEQMKTALITNVSHDLRTPLTSIITYVDLLKKEKFASENASVYLQVLEDKSYRLKNLIEDIIEVNKASTGNMIVNRERINFNELINQSMGEYQMKIEDSSMEFKINIPSEATFIEGDSKSMWRILENLIENSLKYSAENSRIYLDIFKNENNGVMTIKNMSKDALDISPEQLTERFVRGDSARSSEGSGLGLSIAQSLADIQGGNFEVIIDGDLFKVVLTMPLWNDENII